MPGDTSIEWTDASWNPVTGCSKVSPGCAHCYAESLAMSKLKGHRGYPGLPWTPANAAENVVLHPDRLDQPLRWTRPRMVFVNSMSDLFHERIPDGFIAKVFAVMGAARQHVFQVLTKRPERMRDYLSGSRFLGDVGLAARGLGINPWLGTAWGIHQALNEQPEVFFDDYPTDMPNVWLGTSIENRRFVGRADLLRETPAAVRFISAEPLLGPLIAPEWDSRVWAGAEDVEWDDGYVGRELLLDGIDWLIVGGESGRGHRRLDLEWVRALRDACQEQDTTFFVKQLGGHRPGTKLEDLPPDLRIRQWPAKL